MTIEKQQPFPLGLKALKIEHQDEKFFLATTLITMMVMFFVFDSLY